ncbi:energy transducer TonB [Lysobacter olei]
MFKGSKVVIALALAAVSTAALATGGIAAVRKQAVASMVVTGEVRIDERGQVVSHQVDEADKVPSGVVGLLAKAVPQWRFEPVVVDGQPRQARSKMRVRVVARQLENGDYAIAFQDADFPGGSPQPGTVPSAKKMVQPRYPAGALRNGASAAVFVVLKVGPDGRVEDAVAEQVNLPLVAHERVMEDYRKMFGDAGVRAALASTFNPPTAGEGVGKSITVRVPYVFQVNGGKPVDVPYGQWASYVPGPFRPAPWRVGELGSSPDLMATNGGPEPMSGAPGLRLLTPLGEGG